MSHPLALCFHGEISNHGQRRSHAPQPTCSMYNSERCMPTMVTFHGWHTKQGSE
jgi:hypothetical protein